MSMTEIAKNLNVSKALVSLALSDKYGVSDNMKSKIRLYALENGYDFNRLHTSKKVNTTVLFIVPSLEFFHENFWSQIVTGVESVLTENKITLEILSCNNMTNKDGYAVELICKHIAAMKPNGIMMISDVASKKVCPHIKKMNIPMVLIDSSDYIYNDIDHVLMNNYQGGYIAAEHFIKKGHKNLCFVGNKFYTISFKHRYGGFKDCCEEQKDIHVKYLTNPGTPECPHFDKASLEQYLSDLKGHVAIMCANDPIALFIYEYCEQNNIKIGKDISVMGFDDINLCTFKTPKLSSILVHRFIIGKVATETLLDRINGSALPSRTIQIATQLNDRDSVVDFSEQSQ